MKYRRLFNGWFGNETDKEYLINIDVPINFETIDDAKKAVLYAEFHKTEGQIKIGIYMVNTTGDLELITEYEWRDWLSYQMAVSDKECKDPTYPTDYVPCADRFEQIFTDTDAPAWDHQIFEIATSIIPTLDWFNQANPN